MDTLRRQYKPKYIMRKLKRLLTPVENKVVRKHFVVLTSARSGSTFLMNLINSHPNLQMYGELFRIQSLPQPDLLDLALTNPVEYLNTVLHSPQEDKVQATGYKMFYVHAKPESILESRQMYKGIMHSQLRQRRKDFERFLATDYGIDSVLERMTDVWQYLRDNPDIKIIHLIREKRFAQYLSFVKAWQTNVWHSKKTKQQPSEPLLIDPQQCQQYFLEMERWDTYYNMFFSAKEPLQVSFEDLVAAPQNIMNEVCRFLEAPNHILANSTPYIQKSYSKQCVNYEEVFQFFKGTQWEKHFLD